VHSVNEWDPLEEVIVGSFAGAAVPHYHVAMKSVMPPSMVRILKLLPKKKIPKMLTEKASMERERFIQILKNEGVIVREPEPIDFSIEYRTPNWRSNGFCCACPRDSLLVLGDEIIEPPMSWRSRYFETFGYRSLLYEYFHKGAKWSAAPKPQLSDTLFDQKYSPPDTDEPVRYITNESEIVMDAADVMRFGKDLLVLRSNTTNKQGILWLQRHVGNKYRIHEMISKYTQPMHIDDHLMPLCEGKLLINPAYVNKDQLPDFLKEWDILEAPPPDIVTGGIIFKNEDLCRLWINVNVLSLDGKKVIIEESQVSTIKALEKWGFDPIPCPFMHYINLGGVFHCATVDIRRRHT
jgi:glycine amidinotransferase